MWTMARPGALLCGLLLMASVVGSDAVAWGSIERSASREPRTSGPLLRIDDPLCDRQSDAGPSRYEICDWRYLFPLEHDPSSDYSVAWFQFTVKAAPGWCAREALLEMEVAPTTSIVRTVPRRSFRLQNQGRRIVDLHVTGRGTNIVPGTVAQGVLFPPGVIKVVKEDQRALLRWRGLWKKELFLAFGVELSHEMTEMFSFDVVTFDVSTKRCD